VKSTGFDIPKGGRTGERECDKMSRVGQYSQPGARKASKCCRSRGEEAKATTSSTATLQKNEDGEKVKGRQGSVFNSPVPLRDWESEVGARQGDGGKHRSIGYSQGVAQDRVKNKKGRGGGLTGANGGRWRPMTGRQRGVKED